MRRGVFNTQASDFCRFLQYLDRIDADGQWPDDTLAVAVQQIGADHTSRQLGVIRDAAAAQLFSPALIRRHGFDHFDKGLHAIKAIAVLGAFILLRRAPPCRDLLAVFVT